MNADDPRLLTAAARRPWYRLLYVQVLIAIVIGVLLGTFAPDTGAAMKPLGDAFVNLIRMMIAPVIFCTVVHGIATMGDLGRVGRVGIQGHRLFRGRLDAGAGGRAHRGRDRAPRRGLQHRSREARP